MSRGRTCRSTSTTLADFEGRDSQISFSVTHGWSAFGRADHGWQDVGLERGAWFETSITWERFETTRSRPRPGTRSLRPLAARARSPAGSRMPIPTAPRPISRSTRSASRGKLGAQWLAIKSAALDAVIANGGTAGCFPARCRASRSRSPWISPAASRSEPMRVRQRFGDGRELGEQRHGIATPWKSRCIATH